MKVTYAKWLKSPFGTQGLPPENPRTCHIYNALYMPYTVNSISRIQVTSL